LGTRRRNQSRGRVGRSSEGTRAGPSRSGLAKVAEAEAEANAGRAHTETAEGQTGGAGMWARTDGARAVDARAVDAQTVDPESRAREICLKLLTAAPRTRTQLATAMRRRGVPDSAAEAVLGRFTDAGLIDDAAFARAWVESRHYSRGLSRQALAAELRQRGVADGEVRDAIGELDPAKEAATARQLVSRKLAATRGQPPQVRTRRLAGMLARKGYPAAMVFRVVREALEREGIDAAETGLIEAEEDWDAAEP
jgi:regulatory protein